MKELSLYEDVTKYKIRTLLLDGKNIKDILAIMDIPAGTWDYAYWRNAQGFRDFIKDCQDEKLRDQARKNIQEVIDMQLPDSEDPRWLKIKIDTSQFIAETLEKDRFSKKTEEDKDARTPINIQVNTYKKIQALKKSLPPPNKPTLDK